MARKRTPPEIRFRAFMLEVTATGCWIWARPNVNKQMFWTGTRLMSVRRFAYKAHFDTLPCAGLHLRPSCDHSGCINPEHQDVVSKRSLSMTRLTNGEIEAIRARIGSGTYRAIAEEYGTSHQTVYKIAAGKLKPSRGGKTG